MIADDAIGRARTRVYEEAVWLHRMGLVAGSSGNISMLIDGTPLVATTPTDVDYADLTRDDITVVNRSGEMVVGERKATSELPMHLAVYDARPDALAIAHTHSPFATAFAALREPIPLISNEGLGVRALQVEVARFGIPGSREIAEAVVEVLTRPSRARAVLLANHGLLTVGANLKAACRLAHSVELEAQIYQLARTMGEVFSLTQEQYEATVGEYVRAKKTPDQGTPSATTEPQNGE